MNNKNTKTTFQQDIDPKDVETQLLTVLSTGAMLRLEAIRRMKYPIGSIDAAADRCGVIASYWQQGSHKHAVWSLVHQTRSPKAMMYLCTACFHWTILPIEKATKPEVHCHHCDQRAKFQCMKDNDDPE